jgi:hypothetical protein
MRPSILTGQVFVHKPAPGLLVTRQTSPALGGDLGNALMPLSGMVVPSPRGQVGDRQPSAESIQTPGKVSENKVEV